jgi:anti-sigma factor RsiW
MPLHDPLPPLHDPERPDAWAVAYVDGTMTDAERAQFEAHLQVHAECRQQVETLRVAFPLIARVLMEDGPRRSGADYLAVAKAAQAKQKPQPK